jgi:hypothetical protein
MVKVYFESNSHAELVATFENEEIYIKCLPILEKEAKDQNQIITESIEQATEEKDLFEYYQDQPESVKSLLSEYGNHEELNHEEVKGLLKNMEVLGYTFDYGLCCQPFNLRKI